MIIIDDGSSDNILLLQDLYELHNRSYLTVVHAASLLAMDGENDYEKKYERQNLLFNQCIQYTSAEWILIADVDEFIWSPKHGTLPEYLASDMVQDDITAIVIPITRAGMLDDMHRHLYKIVKTADGNVELSNAKGPELLIEKSIRRGPDARLGEPEAVIKLNISVCQQSVHFGGWNLEACCQNCNPKSMVRRDAVKLLGVHTHEVSHGKSLWADIKDVNGWHFFVRSKADFAFKFLSGRGTYRSDSSHDYIMTSAQLFFSSVTERTLQAAFADKVREQILDLMSF